MKLMASLLLGCTLLAQEAPKDAAKETAVPEPVLTGSFDVGYRWRTGDHGNVDAYRSIVNLGEGPKLFGADFTLLDASHRFFDRVDVRGDGWGGEPYTTARLHVRKLSLYDFSFDYRNIAYFNNLPSFADPTAGAGRLFDQQSFDARRRLADFQLDLLPTSWLVPYLAYAHDSGSGRGVTDFVSDANEYPVASLLRDHTDHFRGGVRIEATKFHLTLEQGGSLFKDDQSVRTSDRNPGNRGTQFLGQSLFLGNLLQAYGVRGSSIYSKALFNASPTSRLNLYGQFIYSQPRSDVTYSQTNSGSFVQLSDLLFYTAEQGLLGAQSKQPHTSGNFAAEFRPVDRLRIVTSWLTDRLHTASGSRETDRLLSTSPNPLEVVTLNSAGRFVVNYNQQQFDVIYDLARALTIRGGYRYEWGDSETRPALVIALPAERGELRRHVGLGGIEFRPGQKLKFNFDAEGGTGDHTYFRTSLQDYTRLRARVRYQLTSTLTLTGGFRLLDNQNPAPYSRYDFRHQDESLSVFWTPGGGKKVTFLGEYTRSTLRSDIFYLLPELLTPERSFYRDNAHTGTAGIDLALAPWMRLSLGGSYFLSSGSRPTQYYQPFGRLMTPVGKHLQFWTEWRWYGYAEPYYGYEGFRSHLFLIGFKVTR